MMGIKKYLKIFLKISIITVVIYFITGVFSYSDITSFCRVKIDMMSTRTSRNEIADAIRLLKKNDQESYKIFCRHVNRVSENYCRLSHKSGSSAKGWNEGGCYIRGSKTIYLRPNDRDAKFTTQQRAELLKKYSRASKNFWERF